MIVVDHVTKYYGSQPAVRDLNFRIDEGECVGFLGLNGAGKTTTLRLLSCLLLPTSGHISVRGLDAEREPHEIRKLIGFLPDTPPLYPEMTVEDFLGFAGRLRRMGRAEIQKRMPDVLETTGLVQVADAVIDTLSHGYKQRVGIAQAIIHDPALLILDEPINGLDPVQIVEMREMIRRLRGRHTILLSTHILSEIEQTCDRILMLHRGRITAQGSEEELSARIGGGVAIELRVQASEEAARAALEGVDEVLEVGCEAASGDTVRVRVRAREDVRPAVARAVVEAGLGLLSLQLLSSGLESIFVRLSQGNEDDEGSPNADGDAASATAAEAGTDDDAGARAATAETAGDDAEGTASAETGGSTTSEPEEVTS